MKAQELFSLRVVTQDDYVARVTDESDMFFVPVMALDEDIEIQKNASSDVLTETYATWCKEWEASADPGPPTEFAEYWFVLDERLSANHNDR